MLPLLSVLVDEAGSGCLVTLPPFEDLAETLRNHVERAGITRSELFDSTPTSIPLRFHDLRATGISHLAMLPELTAFDIRELPFSARSDRMKRSAPPRNDETRTLDAGSLGVPNEI